MPGLSKFAWIEHRARTIFSGSVEETRVLPEEHDAVSVNIAGDMCNRYNRAIADWSGHQLWVRTNCSDMVWRDEGSLVIDAFAQSLQLRRDVGDLGGVVVMLNNLGAIAEERCNDQHVLTLFGEALEGAIFEHGASNT